MAAVPKIGPSRLLYQGFLSRLLQIMESSVVPALYKNYSSDADSSSSGDDSDQSKPPVPMHDGCDNSSDDGIPPARLTKLPKASSTPKLVKVSDTVFDYSKAKPGSSRDTVKSLPLLNSKELKGSNGPRPDGDDTEQA